MLPLLLCHVMDFGSTVRAAQGKRVIVDISPCLLVDSRIALSTTVTTTFRSRTSTKRGPSLLPSARRSTAGSKSPSVPHFPIRKSRLGFSRNLPGSTPLRQRFLGWIAASVADVLSALACFAARFSLRDLPDFFVMVWRGDLSDIAGPLHMGGLGGPDSPTLRARGVALRMNRDPVLSPVLTMRRVWTSGRWRAARS